ncbi:MAG: hypothetical protein IKO85_04960 [Bacteroidaceae bacterium]|nr:hypothetical protein [Bacteroidaceae bacterium]
MAATINIIGIGGISHAVVIEEGSIRRFELMKEDYIRLVFSSSEQINIRLGDYITHPDWGTFYITEPQQPTYNKDTGGYDYDLQFNAPYYKWNNKLYKFEPSNNRNEASWSLTDNLGNHMAVFLRNLEHHGWHYTLDNACLSLEEAQRTVFIQFDNKYLLDALTQIAEAFNIEWWITDTVIHFGKVESGEAIDFEVGVNVEDMTPQNASKDAITRFYAFGSTRNIPNGYRADEEQVLLNGVVQKRLMLPSDTPYIDIAENLTDDEIVEGVVFFDEVFPRTESAITAIEEVEKWMKDDGSTVEATDEENNDEELTRVTIYRFKTSSFTFSKDYILPKTDLQVEFTSGKLNGMTFNVVFNPKGVAEKITQTVNGVETEVVNPESQFFEIVINDTYGLSLPNDSLYPELQNKFILIGWDATKIEALQDLTDNAEEELKDKAETYAAKLRTDPHTYPCKMMADYMYGLNNGQQDPNYSKVGTFPLGQRIRLVNSVYFSTGSRVSRVIGYEYKLDIPYDEATIIVGESATYSSKRATEAAINEAKDSIAYRNNSYTNIGGGGSSVYIITSNDTTAPSEGNVYSALRSDRQYPRKNRNDILSSLWTFKDANGVRRGIQTEQYNSVGGNEGNVFGKGFELISQADGNGNTKTRLEVDELFVRIKAFFSSLEIREISYLGGNYVFSSAGSKLYYVDWLDAHGDVMDKTIGGIANVATFRCYLYSDDGTTATINKWRVNDQAMCRTYNIDSGVHQNTSNKYYWRRVTNTGRGAIPSKGDKQYQYVDISASDCALNSDYPEAGDTIVSFGNWTDAARQGIIYLQVEGEGSPAIYEYANVGANGQHFVLPEPSLMLSPKKNVIYGEFHSVVDSEGGNTGNGDSIDDQLQALIDAINDIKNQADKKFELWFGAYEPRPTLAHPNQINYPASEWTTQALQILHAQDLFYDTLKAPATNRGRAWRWVVIVADYLYIRSLNTPSVTREELDSGKEALINYLGWSETIPEADEGAPNLYYIKNTGSGYSLPQLMESEESLPTFTAYWEDVTDQDTIDALEKIADVASDGKLTGGAEKTRVYIDWQKAVQEYLKYKEQAADYGITTELTEYVNAFKALGKLLNGGTDLIVSDVSTVIATPSWLADLQTDTEITSPTNYRGKWNDYYTALAALLKKITKCAKDLADAAQADATTALGKISDMANDGKLDPSEKLTVKREFIAAYHEMMDTDSDGYASGILDMAKDGNSWIITYSVWIEPYITAFRAIGTYLNGGTSWTEPTLANFGDSTLPAWIKDANMGNTQTIAGGTWRNLWAEFYATRTAVLTALTDKAQSTADNAHDRIDDIVSDGVISAGSEKSLLYIDWLKTIAEYKKYIEQASDYFGSTNTQDDALVAAYKKLAVMLNNGNPNDTTATISNDILNGVARPAWLTAANMNTDTVLADTPTANSSTYHSVWNAYQTALTALLEVITKKAKDLADAAQADATTALGKISDMANDGKLDPSEKLDLLSDFTAIVHEYYKIQSKCTTAGVSMATYKSAAEDLFTYLNGGTQWPNGTKTWPPSAISTYLNTIIPSWLTSSNISNTENINSETFRGLWGAFYAARVEVLTLLSEDAKNRADDAQEDATNALGQLSDFADDGVLTPFEKLNVLREWENITSEKEIILANAIDAHISTADYERAYNVLSWYLDDPTSESSNTNTFPDNRTPTALAASGNTTISSVVFKNDWQNFYYERAGILSLMSSSKVNFFVQSSVPTPPYKRGDLWMQTNNGNNMMVCVTGRSTGNGQLSDWADLSDITEKRDPRILLAALANMVYDNADCKNTIKNKGTNAYLTIYGTSTLSVILEGDISYTPTNGIKRYVSGSWQAVTDENMRMALQSVYEAIGEYTIRIFRSRPSITANLYDLVCSPITFTDTNLPSDSEYRTVEGGIQIQMYNGTDWEVLQESAHSLIENLKGYVRALAMKSAGDYTSTAGMITTGNLVQNFATATDQQGRTIAQAYLSAYVQKDSNGKIVSGVTIDADQVNLTGNDRISLAVANAAYNPNLLQNSIINETSTDYGFAHRSLRLENGKKYTFSVSGITPTSLPSAMKLRVYLFRLMDSGDTNVSSDWGSRWAQEVHVDISANGGNAATGSVSFTANRTGTYYITSYLYDTAISNGSNGSGGTRTYPVTVLWYKVEEGEIATNWTAEEADGRDLDNFIVNPLAVSGTIDDQHITSTEVTDGVFGKVVQLSHNVNGCWQIKFTRRDNYSLLTGNHATFYMICKCISASTEAYVTDNNGNNAHVRLCFGYDSSGTQIVVDTLTSPYIDLGDGWRKYYATKKMSSALGSTIGVCHAMGTWRVYAVGIVLGGVCPQIVEIMSKNNLLKTGIDITAGKIKLRADKVTFESSDGSVSGKIWIDPTTGTLHTTNASINGVFESVNTTTQNSIIVDAGNGYIKMRGPNGVQDENHQLPAQGASIIDLFKIQFETDPDGLQRVASLYMNTKNTALNIDAQDGITFTASGQTKHKSWQDLLS